MSDLADLESRIAFQEDAIDKLSDVVARQERELEQLKRMIKILNTQIQQMDSGQQPNDQPPPHY